MSEATSGTTLTPPRISLRSSGLQASLFPMSLDRCSLCLHRPAQPIVKSGRHDPSAVVRHQRTQRERCTEIRHVGARHDPAGIALLAEPAADEVRKRRRFGTRDLADAVSGLAEGYIGERNRDFVGKQRLHQLAGDMDRAIPAPRIRDRADEFEELGGTQDRVGQAGIFDQPLLCELGTEIAATLEPVGTDDRQRDAMPYAGLLRSRDHVARPRLEKVQHRLVLERRRIRDVNDDVSACKRRLYALPGHGVDAPARRRLQHLMTARPQQRGQLRPDETCTADDNDLHFLTPLSLKAVATHCITRRNGTGRYDTPNRNPGLISTTYTGGPRTLPPAQMA